MKKVYKSKEVLTHFRCKKCEKWWTVSTAPATKKKWFCTWCGTKTA